MSFQETYNTSQDTNKNYFTRVSLENLEMVDIQISLEIIFKKIREEVLNGVYADIIAEDASGRIPGLAVWAVMQKIYTARQLPAPHMHFFAGSSKLKTEEQKLKKIKAMAEIISSWKNKSNKILVCTESIITGESLSPLLKAIKEAGRDYEIVTLMTGPRVPTHVLEQRLQGRIIVGEDIMPSTFRKYDFGGVRKNSTDIFAHKYEGTSMKKLASIRRDIASIAEHISAKYIKNNEITQ